MSKSASQTQGVDFDLGTSPHGLAAELQRTHQEARPAESSDSLADAFAKAATSGRACEDGGRPTAHCFTLTEDQRCHLAFAALCHITTLEDSDESEEPEVQTAIRLLIEARDLLMAGRWQL